MAERYPLPALLSQALVAFTIEFDNELEHRMPHRTARQGPADPPGPAGASRAPWLVSMAMWFTCMCYVGAEPMPVTELERLARTPTNLDRMQRWGLRDLPVRSGVPKESIAMALGVLRKAGLAAMAPDPAGGRGKVVRLSAAGQEAQWSTRTRSPPSRTGRPAGPGPTPSPRSARSWNRWPAIPPTRPGRR